MLNTTSDIITEVVVRGAVNTAAGYITDDMLNDWLTEKHRKAASFKKWTFTEGRVSTTFASLVTDEDGNLRGEYPEGWKPDSIRQMMIGGKMVQKKNFRAFHRWREDNPDANGQKSRVFTDYGRLYYLSPNIDLSGTTVLWGQYTPALDATDNTATTIFSGIDEDGNEAIVEMMLAEVKQRQEKVDEGVAHASKGLALLNALWERVKDEQAFYHNSDTGMFEYVDYLAGGLRDDTLRVNRWY